jgi:hypothetical protein
MYVFKKTNDQGFTFNGTGSINMKTRKKIMSSTMLSKIKKVIENDPKMPCTDVVITNYTLLSGVTK